MNEELMARNVDTVSNHINGVDLHFKTVVL
jgi:hypothetical protein